MKERFLVYQFDTDRCVGQAHTFDGAFQLARDLNQREGKAYYVTHIKETVVQTVLKNGQTAAC